MNGKKVLITGGFGNLGSWITIHMASLGYDVYVLTRSEKHKFESIKYSVIECDITNLAELKKKLDIDFNYCIHTASYNEFFLPNYFKQAIEINALGTRNLLEVLKNKNLQNFIYFSTFHVYGQNDGIITEKSDLNPKNDYATTHLFAEYYIKQFASVHNLNYTILRLTNSYGAPTFINTNKWYLVLNDLVKSAYENNKIVLKSNGKAKRDFIYMGDVCNAVEKLLLQKAKNDIFNLSSYKTYEVIELARKVESIYQQRYQKKINIVVNKKDTTSYEELYVDATKLRQFINFDIHDCFSQEIDKIFNLLENTNVK